MYLSGNFGELRTDHFHSGIDIKTQGTTGHHVFAIESGYVSRIKVQANGYGKSIYLSHPGGQTSVYGHLDRYRDDIAEYVKREQYRLQSHQVDIYPEASDFPIEKGDFIAYSGNSGGSMGPHLHFEIRNSANQHPTNVLEYGFNIKDQIAPRFIRLYIYPLDRNALVNGSGEKQTFELVYDQGVYTIPWGTSIEVSGNIGIGTEVYDFLNGSGNRCGVYSLDGFMDEQHFYKHEMKEFAFSETRYVNAHMDYGENILKGRKPHRLYRLPNDKLRIYGPLENDGILTFTEEESHKIRVIARDVAGNESELLFNLRAKNDVPDNHLKSENKTKLMSYKESSVYENGHVRIDIPANALYEDLEFEYSESPPVNGFLSVNYHVHKAEIPLHKPFTLSVQAPSVSTRIQNKLVFVSYDPEEDKIVAAGGEFRNGRLYASLRNFGIYAVSLDTLAPEIIPFKESARPDQRGREMIRFIIRDDLSDIDKYEGYVDNRWALFEYDPKNDLLIYRFDKEKITKNEEHELELYISDSKGNVNLYHSTFTW